MYNQVKISIITISYNSAKTIEDTILSVINQEYNNIEYIIIDGGSTDGTVDIIKKYSDKIYYWISEPDDGIYDAMNKGINIATGDIIGIINSDDWYCNNIFSKIELLHKQNDNAFIHGNLVLINNENKILLYPNLNSNTFYYGTPFFHPTMFVPKLLYDNLGKFNTKYKIAADYDLMLRLIKNNCPPIYLNENIAYMRAGGESDKNVIKGYKEVCFIAIKHGYSKTKTFLSFIKKIYPIIKLRLIKH